MTDASTSVGLLDTNILILLSWIDVAELPEQGAISSITLGELAAGVHLVPDGPSADLERARRLTVLQQAEFEFDPLPYDVDAARIYGRITAAVRASGRSPRRRVADLMIAAVAAANQLPLFTTNPADYSGLDDIVTVIPVTRPTRAP